MEPAMRDQLLSDAQEILNRQLREIDNTSKLAIFAAKDKYRQVVELLEKTDNFDLSMSDPLTGRPITGIGEFDTKNHLEIDYPNNQEDFTDLKQKIPPVSSQNEQRLAIWTILNTAPSPQTAQEICAAYNKTHETKIEKGTVVKFLVLLKNKDETVVSVGVKTSKGTVTYYQPADRRIKIEEAVRKTRNKGN